MKNSKNNLGPEKQKPSQYILVLGSEASLRKLKPHLTSSELSFEAIKIARRQVSFPRSSYDYLLLSSQYAWPSSKKIPEETKLVCVGKATAESLPKKILPVSVQVLRESHRGGILSFFKSQRAKQSKSGPKKKQTIFYPLSSRADTELTKALRHLGYRVQVRRTYQTRLRALSPALRGLVQAKRVKSIVFLSPSAVESFLWSVPKSAQKGIRWIAMGPSTAKRIREAGYRPIQAQRPELKEVLRLARR